jgi:phosphoribosyl 1,2-cyclic phosphodiesterase
MKVIFHGVRGSIPTPLTSRQISDKIEAAGLEIFEKTRTKKFRTPKDVSRHLKRSGIHKSGTFGGNTPCVEVLAENGDRLILDAGSGIRALGVSMLREGFGKGQGSCHILFSHFHFDHIQGIPFFIPVFIPGNTINYYGGIPDIVNVIAGQFKGPYFPVEFDKLGAQQHGHTLEPDREYLISGFKVSLHVLNHPNRSFSYRIERDGKVLVYATDSEFMDRPAEEYASYRKFFADADCFIVDTQYAILDSMTTKFGWGHSSPNIDIDLAHSAGVKSLYFFHYDPLISDEDIVKTFRQSERYRLAMHPKSRLKLRLSYEGLTVKI